MATEPRSRRILFLDIDGVLNHQKCCARYLSLSKPCVRRLHRVIQATRCEIVMSSTWRKLPDHREAFLQKTGIEVLGYTPTLNDPDPDRTRRGREIALWIEANGHPSDVHAIIDDDSDMLPEQLPFFVKTRWTTGMLDRHVRALIDLLR